MCRISKFLIFTTGYRGACGRHIFRFHNDQNDLDSFYHYLTRTYVVFTIRAVWVSTNTAGHASLSASTPPPLLLPRPPPHRLLVPPATACHASPLGHCILICEKIYLVTFGGLRMYNDPLDETDQFPSYIHYRHLRSVLFHYTLHMITCRMEHPPSASSSVSADACDERSAGSWPWIYLEG